MTRRRPLPDPWLVAGLTLALLQGGGLAAMAQISPNCPRNGRPAFCAVTPRPDLDQGDTAVEVITFADHTMVEARREQGSCKPVTATYRGTAYEGGYTNAYSTKGFNVRYRVID